MRKERLAQAVDMGHYARTTVEALAEAAKELALEPTEEKAHVLIGLIKMLESTAGGWRWA